MAWIYRGEVYLLRVMEEYVNLFIAHWDENGFIEISL